MSNVVKVEVEERVATVTLHRPEARNALNIELLEALPGAISSAEDDPDVDVVILTGADPAFSAGLDLKELGAGAGTLDAGDATGVRAAVSRPGRRGPIPPMTKPLIGAINGAAVTGGFELALQCDFLVASERARFADTHARVGLQPGWGLSVLLPQAIGRRRARELSLTGNFLDAHTALEWGLVNHVVAHDELLPFTIALARDICSIDQAAGRRLLATYAEGSWGTAGEALALESRVATAWIREGGGTADEIERRRQAIVDRGRSQI